MQIKQVKDFAIQIETVAKKCNWVIITGAANLCSIKWNVEKYVKGNIAIHIKNAVEQCGLLNQLIGNTYIADHITQNGEIPESAIDHVYHSKNIKEKIDCKTLPNSSTDHLPVITTYAMGRTPAKIYSKQIMHTLIFEIRGRCILQYMLSIRDAFCIRKVYQFFIYCVKSVIFWNCK